jgi:hypothetical protein
LSHNVVLQNGQIEGFSSVRLCHDLSHLLQVQFHRVTFTFLAVMFFFPQRLCYCLACKLGGCDPRAVVVVPFFPKRFRLFRQTV